MAEKKMQAPSGMAGLVRYYEEDKAIIKFKPEHIVGLCAFLVVLQIGLLIFFPL